MAQQTKLKYVKILKATASLSQTVKRATPANFGTPFVRKGCEQNSTAKHQSHSELQAIVISTTNYRSNLLTL